MNSTLISLESCYIFTVFPLTYLLKNDVFVVRNQFLNIYETASWTVIVGFLEVIILGNSNICPNLQFSQPLSNYCGAGVTLRLIFYNFKSLFTFSVIGLSLYTSNILCWKKNSWCYICWKKCCFHCIIFAEKSVVLIVLF